MTDIESLVFTKVSAVLNTEYDSINIVSEPTETPSEFPCVCIVESDNSDSIPHLTIGNDEPDYCDVTYTIDVFTNKVGAKKSQAKEIMDVVNVEMHKLGFIRNMRSQTPNMDRTVYRLTARYSGRVQQIADSTGTNIVVHGR